MRFWDSSALVPLLTEEDKSGAMFALLENDGAVVVWWATSIECASAISRKAREEGADDANTAEVFRRLDLLTRTWGTIAPNAGLRRLAIRLLRVHALRAADAQQLAAALVAAEDLPESLTMVSLDDRLAAAARKEGLRVIP